MEEDANLSGSTVPVVQAHHVSDHNILETETGIFSSSRDLTLVSAFPMPSSTESHLSNSSESAADTAASMDKRNGERQSVSWNSESNSREQNSQQEPPMVTVTGAIAGTDAAAAEARIIPARPIPLRPAQRVPVLETPVDVANADIPNPAAASGAISDFANPSSAGGGMISDDTAGAALSPRQNNPPVQPAAIETRADQIDVASCANSTSTDIDGLGNAQKRPRLDDAVRSAEQNASVSAVSSAATAAAVPAAAAFAAASAGMTGQQQSMMEVQALLGVRTMEKALCAQYERYLTALRLVCNILVFRLPPLQPPSVLPHQPLLILDLL